VKTKNTLSILLSFFSLIIFSQGNFDYNIETKFDNVLKRTTKTNTIGVNDTTVFDIKNSIITPYSVDSNYINIPAYFISDDNINAFDFRFKFNMTKITFVAVEDVTPGYLSSVYNVSQTNLFLFYISYRSNPLEFIVKNGPLTYIKFKFKKSCNFQLNGNDFYLTDALLDGIKVSSKFTSFGANGSILQSNFTTSPLCLNSLINFKDESQPMGSISSWQWNFGNGLKSTIQNPTTTYTTPGAYSVSLVVKSSDGCKDSINRAVVVGNNPVSSFTYNLNCIKDSVFFTNTSSIVSGTIASSLWNFGDGTPSSILNNPTHKYSAGGNYTVSLTSTSTSSCASTSTLSIQLFKPISDFVYSSLNACIGSVFNFTNTSSILSGSITSSNWDFGDGSTPTNLLNPTHTFTASGTYTVTLISTSNNGCTASITKIITISSKPIVQFAANTLTGCAPLNVNFTDNSTNANAATYKWYYGDNSPLSAQQNSSNSYTASGFYNVKLVVSNTGGCSDSLTKSSYIEVKSTPITSFTLANKGCVNSPIIFTDNSSISSGTINSWDWDFGDGSINGLTKNATHTYTTTGTYEITLTSSTGNGCFGDIQKTITISSKPIAQFTVNNVTGCAPLTANFTDNSTNTNGATYKWYYGDGSPLSTQQNPSYSYTASGFYNVKLVVSDDGGCSDSITKPSYIEVKSTPTASFTSANNGCLNSAISFSDNSSISSGIINSWDWNFGDGSANNLTKNPTHTYTTTGTYSITLKSTTGNGCFGNIAKSITINSKPIVQYTVNSVTGCVPLNVNFTDNSTNTNGATYKWYYGDNSPLSTQQNPSYSYTASGFYNVKLVVNNAGGCSDSITKSSYIEVKSSPIASFTSANGTCINSSISFINTSSVAFGSITAWDWQFGNGASSALKNPTTTFTTSGVYVSTLTVSNGQFCNAVFTKTITIDNKPIINFIGDNLKGCSPSVVNFTNTSVVPVGSSFLWNFENSTASSKDASNTYTASGSFSVKNIITTPNGCVDSLVKTNYITIQHSPKALYSVSTKSLALDKALFNFTNKSTDFTNVLWNFGNNNTSIINNPFGTYVDTGSYKICLTAYNSFSCTNVYCDSIKVFNSIINVAIPEAFTPNNDNTNDILKVRGGPFSDIVFRVFNEWGNLLFESNEQAVGWDGTYKGAKQPSGAYEYTVKGMTTNNKSINLYGVVNLIR